MEKIQYLIAIIVMLVFFSIIQSAFAESESFTVAARSYEQIGVYLNQGDELEFRVLVSGGVNDDIELTIFMPDGQEPSGFIYEEYSDTISAPATGTYVFSFSNTFSLVSNKQVNFTYDRIRNTYFIYVDPLPEWASYASNVMFEATEFWKAVYPKLNFFVADSETKADFIVKWVKDFGQEHVGYAYGDKFLEVGLGDSNCGNTWNPYSGRHVSKIMKHEIGHILGLGHSSDPDDIMYPYASQTEYGLVEREFTLRERTAQFVPLCTGKQTTSFEFSVKTDDPVHGFDVYFVPSGESLELWSKLKSFPYYSAESCFGEGFLNYVGECNGISNAGGLLIIMDKETTSHLTNVNVVMQEKPYSGGPQKTSLISNIYEEPLKEIVPKPEEIPRDIFQQQNQVPKTESKSTEPQPQANQISCGEGTILVEGKCVPKNQSAGGGCLIATAAYGTELAPQVQQLREIRDNTLLQTNSGSAFMEGFNQFYYSFSPSIADLERQNPIFKEAVKLTITPLLTSLSILNYVEIDSEEKMLGYGISLILLNVGMYFAAPVFAILRVRRFIS